MHKNFRRKIRRNGNHHWQKAWWKKQCASDRRAEERSFLERGLWDRLFTNYPKTILWDIT